MLLNANARRQISHIPTLSNQPLQLMTRTDLATLGKRAMYSRRVSNPCQYSYQHLSVNLITCTSELLANAESAVCDTQLVDKSQPGNSGISFFSKSQVIYSLSHALGQDISHLSMQELEALLHAIPKTQVPPMGTPEQDPLVSNMYAPSP
jgi:hypothetical protein